MVGFGAMRLPKDDEESTRALNRALDLGINFVDSARAYDHCESERKIGAALKHRRGEYILCTKTLARDAASLRQDLETSLRLLQTDYLDLYLLHSVSAGATWEQVMAPGGAWGEARKAKEQGLVRHIGASMHCAVHEMELAINSGEYEALVLAYSPLDGEGVEPRVLPLARERDVGVIVMKPFNGGRLSLPAEMKRPGEPDPVVAACMRFVLSNPAVSIVIPGMESTAQVEENVATIEASTRLSDRERDELFRAMGPLQKSFSYGQVCLRCGYCQPCPHGIVVPEVFRALQMARDYPDALKYLGRELYESLEVRASACVACEECIPKCPAGLIIPERLKEAVAEFE